MFGFKRKAKALEARHRLSIQKNFHASFHTGAFFESYLQARERGGLYTYDVDLDLWKFPCGSLQGYKLQNLTEADIIVDIQGPNGSSFWAVLFKKERYGYNMIGLNRNYFRNYSDTKLYCSEFLIKTFSVFERSVPQNSRVYCDANFRDWLLDSEELIAVLKEKFVANGDARG